MRTATRKILIAVTALLAAICLAFGTVMFVTTSDKNSLSDEKENVTAMGALQSYDATYTLSNGSHNSDWAAAVASTNANKKIYVVLVDSWSISAPLTIGDGTNDFDITFDLNGKTVDRGLTSWVASGGNIFNVKANATLRLTDSVGGGKLTGGYTQYGGGAVFAEANSKFYMDGGIIENCNSDQGSGGAILIAQLATFEMNAGTIQNCKALGGNGGAIACLGTGVMNGGTIQSCFANKGGGVSNTNDSQYGSWTMNGGSILNNGAVYNSGGGDGGGIYMNGTATETLTITGGTISGCTSMMNGGGIRTVNVTTTMSGGSISGNYGGATQSDKVTFIAGSMGGGVSADGKFTMTGGTISGNEAHGNGACGGGIYSNSTLILNSGTITNNSTGNYGNPFPGSLPSATGSAGGGIYLNTSCTLKLGAVTVTGNKTTVTSGANLVTLNGGGIYASAPGNVTLMGGTIVTDNYTNGTANKSNLYLKTSAQVDIGARLIKDGRATQIGLSFGYSITSRIIVTQNYTKESECATQGFTGTNFSASNYNPLITDASGVIQPNSPNPPASYYFSSDSSSYKVITSKPISGSWVQGSHDCIVQPAASLSNPDQLTWQYTTSPSSAASKTWTTVSGGEGNLLELTYGNLSSPITAVRCISTDGTNDITISTEYSAFDYSNAADKKCPMTVYNDSFGNNTFPSGGISQAGTYGFAVGDLTTGWAQNGSMNVIIKPKDITLTLNSTINVPYGTDAQILQYLKEGDPSTNPKTPFYTLPSGSLVGTDKIELDFVKGYGTATGKTYPVTAKAAAPSSTNDNGNYNIKVTGSSLVTIIPREVRIILNDDYYTYGDAKMQEGKVVDNTPNSTPLVTNSVVTRTENTTTAYKDDAGNNKTGTASAYYKGGWYYPATLADGVTATTAYDKLEGATLTSNVPTFFEYTWVTSLTSGTDYSSSDANKYLNVRSKEAKAADATAYPNEYYEIKVKNTNANYKVTFLNSDGTAFTTPNEGKFKLEVRRAEQSGLLKGVNETPTAPDPKVGKYLGATYDGTAKTIALPDIALHGVIKGLDPAAPTYYGPLATDSDGLVSTTSYYKYLVYDKAKLIMSPAVADTSDGEIQCPLDLEPLNGTPTATEMADAIAYVEANEDTTHSVNTKGTYVVYVVAEPTNHKPKVYKYEYKLDVSGIKYRIVVEQKKTDGSNTVVSTLTLDSSSNYALTGAKNNKVTYDPDLKVEARVIYEWQTEFVSTATDTAPTGWNATDGSAPDVELYYKGQAATIASGTPAHANAWGYGYMSTDTGVDTNAVDNSGKKADGTTDQKLGYNVAPTEAGEYVVSFLDKNAANSNFNLVPDVTNGDKIKFEIERKELKKPDAPLPQGTDTGVYTGLAQTYAIVPKADGSYTYKMSMFKAGKVTSNAFDGSGFNTGLTEGTASDSKKEYTVTNAGKYKIALQLPLDNSYATDGTPNGTKPRNYKWENEATKDYIEVELELKQKELQVNWKFLKDGSPNGATPSTLGSSYKANVKGVISTEWKGTYKPTQKYDNTGNPELDTDGFTPLWEEPVLEYYYKYITDKVDGTGTIAIGNLQVIDPAKIESLKDSSNAHGAGVYVVGVRLSTDPSAKAVNANYKFDTTIVDTDPNTTDGKYNVSGKPYFKQIEITAGEADLNDIEILYQKGSEPEAEIEDDTEFVYSIDSSGNAIGYKFNLNFDNIDYLDDSKIVVSYQKWDGSQYVDIADTEIKPAGKYRVKFGIEVKSTDTQHQLPPTSGTDCYDTTAADAKFVKYERNTTDPKKGTLYYEVEIERAEVDLSKLVLQYQSGSAAWTNYDSTKPPKRTGLPYSVKVHPTADLPYGVTSASVDTGSYGSNQTEPGKVTFEIEFDLDDNYKYTVYQKDANGDLVLDGNNKPIVVTVYSAEDNTGTGVKYETYIQIAKEQLKIKWKYAPLKDPSGNDIIDTTTGQPFRYRTLDIDSKYNGVYVCVYTYAGDTQEYYGAAGLNQLRINNGIDSTNPQTINVEVRIVDNSADLTKPQFQDQYEFASGSRTTTFQLGQKMYGVTVQVNHDAMEYSDAPVGAIYSLVPDADATTFDSSWCTVTLWKGTTNLGEYSAVDLATLDAGVYTVKFELIEAAQNTYLLSQDSFTFTVDQKELEVPELTANGVFNAKNQKLVDLLQVGKKSFNDAYKDLIAEGILVLGGDFDGRNAGDYEATITITSDNYIWKKSASSTAKLLKVSLADEELPKAEIDSAKKVASYEWSIAPFVITSDMVSKSKENGLELNLPEWIAALTAGEVPTLGWEQNVYESASSNSKLNGAEGFAFESGKEYYISVSLNGEDAKNFIFQDSKTNISNKVEYQVAVSGFSAAMTKALDFLKSNWWWLLIILGAILFLILLIVLIKKHKKNKEAREEKRRLEEEKREEKERKERERQEEKERRELEKQEEKERREQERREEKERREEEERRRREEEERRRREEEERRRNTPIPIPMPQMAATMQSQLQAQPQMQAQPQPQQAQPQPQPQPQAQPKQQPQKPKKRPNPNPSSAYIQGYVPTSNGLMPVKIHMKKKGSADNMPMPTQFGNPFGMSMNPMGMQMPMMPQQPMGYQQQGYPQPQYGMDMRTGDQRVAEERARMNELRIAEERANTRIAEERARTAEERARKSEGSNSGMSPEMMALFLAAIQNRASAPAYQPIQPTAQQPAQPIFITGPQPSQQPQPILITNQQPVQPQQPMSQDGRPVVPPGAVMTTTSTTTIDATKRQNPNGTAYEYDDNYDYGVFEQFDDKNN